MPAEFVLNFAGLGRAAIDEIFTEDCVFYEPKGVYHVLYFRFLFVYDSVSFQGPMVSHHELTHRVNAHGATRRPDSVDIAPPGIHRSLRLSRNAATLALLPSENLA
jgi:hypothetical protein